MSKLLLNKKKSIGKIYDRIGSAPAAPVAAPPERHFDRTGMDRDDRRDERAW